MKGSLERRRKPRELVDRERKPTHGSLSSGEAECPPVGADMESQVGLLGPGRDRHLLHIVTHARSQESHAADKSRSAALRAETQTAIHKWKRLSSRCHVVSRLQSSCYHVECHLERTRCTAWGVCRDKSLPALRRIERASDLASLALRTAA